MKIKQNLIGLFFRVDFIYIYIAAIGINNFFEFQPFNYQVFFLALPIALVFYALLVLLKYLFEFYIITDTTIEIHKGFIFKKIVNIPFENISTLSIHKSLLHQLFNCHRVSIDTNDTIPNDDALIISHSDYLILNRIVNQESSNIIDDIINIDDYSEYHLTIKSLIKFSIANLQVGYFIAFVFFVIGFAVDTIGLNLTMFNDLTTTLNNPFLIISMLILFILTAVITSIIINFIKFYNYRIVSYNEYYLISYGLFNKKTFKLEKKYVNGVKFKQNILEMLFKIKNVEVINTGYGSHGDRDNTVVPYLIIALPIKDYDFFIDKILEDYKDFKTEYFPIRKAFIPYFILNIVFLAGILVVISITTIINYYLLLLCFVLIIMLRALTIFLDIRLDSIAYDNNNLYCAQIEPNFLINITYNTYIIKNKGILRLDYKTNAFLRLFNAGYITINTLNNYVLNTNIKFKMYPYNIYQKICTTISKGGND